MPDAAETPAILKLTASIVAAHVSRNPVPVGDLPALISGVFSALKGAGQASKPTEPGAPEPAVPVKKLVHRDYLVCLEDGKKLKMLKRHLSTAYGMTPDQYRAKWGLPSDYPMVAPAYAERRSTLAKEIGLGTARGRRAAPQKRKGK